MASRRSTIRCASCRATYWSDDAHRCEVAPKQPQCPICLAPTPAAYMCRACCRDYDRNAFGDASVMGAIAWAARRARGKLPAAKPRRWRKIHPHEYTLRMGPVRIVVSRWHSAVTSRTEGDDVWGWAAAVGDGPSVLRGHHVDKGAPLAQCQADAIAAVERWRDGIR